MIATLRVVVVAALAAATVMVLSGPATAADCVLVERNGQQVYICDEVDPGGNTGGGGTGGSGAPPCEFRDGYDDLCLGSDACWWNNPAAVQEPEELEGTPKPSEDSHVIYINCIRPDGSTYDRWYWSEDFPEITIEDRIRSAMGAIDFPTIEASFNPPGRTLVNLDTWWWAEGAPEGEIRGSQALSMVGIATPRGLQIDPGDGSGPKMCPMSVVESDICTYEYRRSGDYTSTMSIVYDIVYVMGGQELTLDQVPEEFRTATIDDEIPVQVREVQTRVTKVR